MSDPRPGRHAYRAAGVDVAAADAAVALIEGVAARATRPEVVEGVGGFAGLFDLGEGRLLAAATDGVGTKLEVARLAGRLETVGIDLVAMSANDVVCTGAEPLFFVDYLAAGKIVPDEVSSIVAGVAEGCRRAGCALLGGETAEHPGTLEGGRFDLAGFCVGMVHRDDLLGPHRVRPGDTLLGLPSTGLHANGFSLVRKILVQEQSLDEFLPEVGRTLGDELLEPTAIYVRPLLALVRQRAVSAAAHITGGGFHENLPRALPAGLGARIDPSAWRAPPIFGLLSRAAGLDPSEMFSVFNMGVGMVAVVPSGQEEHALSACRDAGIVAATIGEVTTEAGVAFL